MATYIAPTGSAAPIEMRWSTAQLVRMEGAQYVLQLPILAVPLVLSALDPSRPSLLVVIALYLGLSVVITALDFRRRRRQVLWLTDLGIYVGRDDGKRSGWIGGAPIQIPWGTVRGVRIIERRWSRTVIVDTTGLSRLLPFPASSSLHPDPELDDRVDLIRRTWDAWRGPLLPPQVASWVLPVDPPKQPGPPVFG